MKSADAPYSLVLSCADALTELVKVRALVDQAESFRPKLGEMRDFLANYGEVRNEVGKRLSSGRLTDKDLTLVRENLLLLSELSGSLNALAASSGNQLRKNLPALADEMAEAVNDWQARALKTRTADLDEMVQSGRALEKDISLRLKKAGELNSRLCCCRALIDNNKSLADGQHAIFKTAADLLSEAKSVTAEKLNRLLTKSKRWSDDHDAFSKEYENLIQLLTKDVDEIDQIVAPSTDGSRRSLTDYSGQIESWLAEVRMFLGRAATISSKSALALGEHSKLTQFYGDSQNFIESFRCKVRKKQKFVIVILGTLGVGIGFLWINNSASMFIVASLVAAICYAVHWSEWRASRSGAPFEVREGDFWGLAILITVGLCAVGLLVMGADWLLSWLFDSWSLIGWLPKWLAVLIPLKFAAFFTLGYEVTMCALILRNFLPLAQKRHSALQSPQRNFLVEDPEPFRLDAQAMLLSNRGESGLVSPATPQPVSPPLPKSFTARVSVSQAPAPAAITPPPSRKSPVETTAEIPIAPETEPTCVSHLLEAEIPPQLLSRIRERVKREYRGDSESQRSEMESQMESYSALQDIVAQPPDGLDVQTLAKIVSRAQREHPLDLQMQLHEVERQIEGHAEIEHFSDSANSGDVPSGILNKIIRRAKREHSNDFSLQSHELQEQMSAYIKITELRNSPPPGVNRKQISKAIAVAEREWPDDYSMQIYHIEQGFEDDTD